MFIKKSLVLKSTDNSDKRAILTIENDGFETSGNLRLYNFSSEPRGIISLGIFVDGKVEKAGLTRKENMIYSFGCNLKELPNNFSCAIVNFYQGQSSPILYGNNNGATMEGVFDSVVMALSDSNTLEETENILNKHQIDYDDDLKAEFENEIDKCMGECENCKYKKYYFEDKLASQSSAEEQEKEEILAELKFYSEIKGQIDQLFDNNPCETYLQNLIPNSKWVKVKVDDEGNFYVLGLIYEDGDLKYICYGVPGVYQETPPRQLSGYPVWFALDETNPQNFGYWLSYQDADTGESVKAVVV